MAVYKHEDEEAGLEAACALGCSCLLSCGLLFGLFFSVAGAVLCLLSYEYQGDTVFVVKHIISLQTFAIVVLCFGAVLTLITLSCVLVIKCCQFYIKQGVQRTMDKNTPLVSRTYNYHYNSYSDPQTDPPPGYREASNSP